MIVTIRSIIYNPNKMDNNLHIGSPKRIALVAGLMVGVSVFATTIAVKALETDYSGEYFDSRHEARIEDYVNRVLELGRKTYCVSRVDDMEKKVPKDEKAIKSLKTIEGCDAELKKVLGKYLSETSK